MEFVSRNQWGARARKRQTSAPNMTLGVGVHWLGETGHPISHDHCSATMRWVQNLHMDDRRWVDFGYNAGACPHGVVYEGRGPRIRNAANGGVFRNGVDANAGWAGVVYLGSKAGPPVTRLGMDAINDAAEWLGVAGGEWLGHKDFKGTECPGDVLYSWAHNGHPRGSENPVQPVPDKEDQLFFFWHHKGLYLAGSGWRSPWAMHPDNIDPLVASGRYPITGKFDQPNDLFDMLTPIARDDALVDRQGYEFEEEPEFSFRHRQILGV
jgi:hypothetical protein